MQLSNSPGKLVLPFANSGNKNSIPVASQIGITPGAASLADGFPPLTMTPVAAGGVPPSGLDMNGILFELSAVVRWANAGGGYPFDADFATDINVNGYPKGARVMRSDGLGYWFNTVENNTTDPEAAGAAAAGWVPDFTNGVTVVTMTSANVTLTPLQYGKPIIVITGTLTANLNLIFPALAGEWTVVNSTTGSYAITCKTAAGVGIKVYGVRKLVSDGTTVRAVGDNTVIIEAPSGGDDTAKFQAAINYLLATGGGRCRTLAGNYRIDGTVSGGPNIHLDFDQGVVIDGSNSGTGDIFQFMGTVGNEIATAANVTRGDVNISTVAAHGLAANEWFLIVGQRACLHADAGEEWRLGDPTGSGSMAFFGEPCQVAAVGSPTALTVRNGLLFPNYRTDRTLETYVATRVTTIRKINFLDGVKITGGKFIVRGTGTSSFPNNPRCAIRLMYCNRPIVQEQTFDLGPTQGYGFQAVSCLNGEFKMSAVRPANWSLGGVDHSAFNSFKDISGWYNSWDIVDINGSQGLDCTYAGHPYTYYPGISPKITGRAFNAREGGVTFHAGYFGGSVDNFEAYNCQQSGINCRSRFVDINNPRIINNGNVTGSAAGVFYFGWGVDCKIAGGHIEGYDNGIRVIRDGDSDVGPAKRNMLIEGVSIARCNRGVYLYKSQITPETALNCGVSIRNLKLAYLADSGVLLDDYWNGVDIDGVDVDVMTGFGRVIFINGNSVNHKIKNISTVGLPAGGTAIYRASAITDTTTFPTDIYRTPRLQVDWPSVITDGNGSKAALTSTWFYRPTSDFTLAVEDSLTPIFLNSTTGKTITVPADADADFPIGTKIEIYQESSGQVTISAAPGVTINTKNGLKISGQGGRVTLFKRLANQWWLTGDTSA